MVWWLAVVAVTTPLAASLTANAWAAIWEDDVARPVSGAVNAALHVAQLLAVALAVTPRTRAAGLAAVAAVYLVMAVGVLALRRQHGSVPCGCFGASDHQLSASLAAFDAACGALAMAAAYGVTDAPAVGGAIATAALVAFLGFVTGVVTPEGRRAVGRYRTAAGRYMQWVRDVRDLQGAVR